MKRAFFILSLLLLGNSLKAETLLINKFSGLNSDDSPLTLSDGQTADSENVITDDGPGLQGRKGYISFSTQTPRAMWEFPKSDGTRYLIADVSGRLLADTGSGTFTTLVSTVPSDRTVAGSVLGDKFFFTDTLNGMKYWDGTSVTVSSPSLKVDKLVTWKGRLAAAGLTASQRTIFISKLYDGTSWTAPTNPSDDDATVVTVSGALDENIQALFSSFKDLLVWFKKNSFGGIYGSRRSNFSQRTFSDYIGVANPETIRDCDGFLRWLGNNRIVWEFDGSIYKKISEQIDNLLAAAAQGDSSSKSNTQTTQAQFEAGTQSPAAFLDTTSTPGSLTPRTSSFIDTDGSTWFAGSDVPTAWTNKSSSTASLQLSTEAAVTSFVDTSEADFEAGTFTRMDSTTTVNSILLQRGGSAKRQSHEPGSTDSNIVACSGYYIAQSFTPTSGFIINSVEIKILKNHSPTYDPTVLILSDSSGVPGSILGTTTIDHNSVATGASFITASFSTPIRAAAGTRYWVQLVTTPPCTLSDPYYAWSNTALSSSGDYSAVGASISTDFKNYHYKINGTTFAASGNIVSRSFDVGFTTASWLWAWGALTANSSLPTNTSITYETQTSADSSNWDSAISVTSGNNPTSTVRRYVRYKASFSTTDTSTSPALNDLTIAMSSRIRPAAVFTSRGFDTGFGTPIWGVVDFSTTAFLGGGANSFFTQSSSDGTTWDAQVAATDLGAVGSTRKRYIRYVWTSTATSTTIYQKLDDLTITAKATGTFTTQAVNVGNLVSAWGPISAATTNNGGSFTMYFSTSTDGITFSSYSIVANNTVPTVSTAPYADTRFLFTIDAATQTPTLDDVTINWTEGSNIKAASAYINQRYWLAVATGSSTNNLVYVFDKLRQWQRYRIAIAATSLYNSRLYFGNASGTFQAESGYSDNSSAIASYYNTPTLIPNKLDLYSNFDYLYMTTDPSDSTLASVFSINGIPTNYTMGSVLMNATTGIQNFKLPFSAAEVQTGKNIGFKWSVSGTSFWRIDNGTLYHQPLALPE